MLQAKAKGLLGASNEKASLPAFPSSLKLASAIDSINTGDNIRALAEVL